MKFSLTKNTKNLFGITLYQIKAEMSFGNISKGDLGGYIEKKENLSEEGDAWVYGNALVYGNAQVYGDARVYGNAQVYGDAKVYGNAWVSGNAQVYGDAQVYGNAQVSGNAWVYGNAMVSGNAQVYGNALVYGKLSLTSGYFFGYKEKKDEIKYFSLGDDIDYELIGKGDCKVEWSDGIIEEL